MSELNDKELFENAIADTPAETPTEAVETPQIVDEPANDGRERDEKGRFVAKAEDAPAEPAPQVTEPAQRQETEAHVPSWRLREVNEAREAAERRAQETETRFAEMRRQFAAMQAQLQKPQEPVDFYADPQAAMRQSIDPLKSEFQTALEGMRSQFSEMMARQSIGDTKFDEVKKWAMGKLNDPVLSARIERSPHPWGELVKAHEQEKTLSEIGGDVSSFKNKILEEAMKDPAFQAKVIEAAKAQAAGHIPGTKPNTVVQLPPSINRATSAASPHEETGDLSNASLYAAAIR